MCSSLSQKVIEIVSYHHGGSGGHGGRQPLYSPGVPPTLPGPPPGNISVLRRSCRGLPPTYSPSRAALHDSFLQKVPTGAGVSILLKGASRAELRRSPSTASRTSKELPKAARCACRGVEKA